MYNIYGSPIATHNFIIHINKIILNQTQLLARSLLQKVL